MKLFKTLLVVASFISINAGADDNALYLGVGQLFNTSDQTSSHLSFEYLGKYTFQLGYVGDEIENTFVEEEHVLKSSSEVVIKKTKKSYKEKNKSSYVAIGKNFYPFNNSFYTTLGIAHVGDHSLISNTNFLIGAGWRIGPVKIGYRHISNFDVEKPNEGLDMFTASINLVY